MKKKIPGILFGLMFLIGFGILVYPTVADQWNTYRQSRLISSYERTVEEMEPEDFSAEWEKARAFNDTLTQNSIYVVFALFDLQGFFQSLCIVLIHHIQDLIHLVSQYFIKYVNVKLIAFFQLINIRKEPGARQSPVA